MKKILTAVLAVIVAALALTGCDNSEKESNNNTSSTTVSSTETSSTDEGTSSDETSSDDTESEPEIPALIDRLEFPDTKSGKMAKAAIEYDQEAWSSGMTIADEESFPYLLPDLDPAMFEEYCFVYDMMPINGHTIFAGKPAAGQEDAAKTALESTLEARKEQVSFYPAGQEAAANAQIGTTNDGYLYFVIHQDGSAIADAMTK